MMVAHFPSNMLTPDQSNYFTAQRLSRERTCKHCGKQIEANRILWTLNKRLNLPETCSMCAFNRKHSKPA